MYHGTYKTISRVDLKRGNKRVDFGRGFYLSDSFDAAKWWAVKRFPEKGGVAPTIMCYEVDDAVFTSSEINLMKFGKPSKEWLEFVKLNRRKDLPKSDEPRHFYDVVYGHIADDLAADTIAEYVEGNVTWDEALSQIKTVPDVRQMSLHTPLALQYIKVREVWEHSDGEWRSVPLSKQ